MGTQPATLPDKGQTDERRHTRYVGGEFTIVQAAPLKEHAFLVIRPESAPCHKFMSGTEHVFHSIDRHGGD